MRNAGRHDSILYKAYSREPLSELFSLSKPKSVEIVISSENNALSLSLNGVQERQRHFPGHWGARLQGPLAIHLYTHMIKLPIIIVLKGYYVIFALRYRKYLRKF